MKCAVDGCGRGVMPNRQFCPQHVAKLLITGPSVLGPLAPDTKNQHAGCDERIRVLEAALQWEKDRYAQLHKTYLQLVDQWSAFQMQFRNVTPRQANRAEAAGELSRLLANALLCLAYDKDGADLLAEVLRRLQAGQRSAQALAPVDRSQE